MVNAADDDDGNEAMLRIRRLLMVMMARLKAMQMMTVTITDGRCVPHFV